MDNRYQEMERAFRRLHKEVMEVSRENHYLCRWNAVLTAAIAIITIAEVLRMV